VSTLLHKSQWVETQQEEFAARTGAVRAFWPEFRNAINELLEEEPAKDRIKVHTSDDEPHHITLSAGLFDLKLACDTLSDIVFYAFTSASLKRLIPRESAIFYHGQLKLTRGYWGIIDSPGAGISRVFADDPQTVEHFPLATRFAQWCIEQLLGGYTKISALEEAEIASAKAQAEAKNAKKKKGEGDVGRDSGE
jgi:hypothetical protein